jgi:hypothetical protein
MAISIADPVSRNVRPADRAVAYLLLDGLPRPRQAKSQDAVLCALGLDRAGIPRPLALRVVAHEGEQAWIALLRHLKSSGIGSDLLLISCDGHPSLIRAIRAIFPDTPVQISIAHRLLALARKVDLRWRAACLAEARTIFSASDPDGAVARFREWRTNWLRAGYRAVSSLESDLASCLMFYRFPQALWPKIRTVNLVERVFREARQAVFPPPELLEPDGEERVASEPVSRNGAAPTPVLALPAGQTTVHAEAAGFLPPPGVNLSGLVESSLSEPRPNGHVPPPPDGNGQRAIVHIRDLGADADFMWWLTQQRSRTDSRLHDLALAALAVLTGLMVGLALMWVL